MTYHLKRNHLKNWDLQQINEKSIINFPDDDGQDIYISERSSVTSSNDTSQILTKRLPIQTQSLNLSLPTKPPHTLRYQYNELPQNGISAAIQSQFQRKQDRETKKILRKAPTGQGSLVPFPKRKPAVVANNYCAYWDYSKLKNPEWIMRQPRAADGQIIPYESFDPSKYVPQPEMITSSIKSKKPVRKSQHNDLPAGQSKQNKQRLDHTEKNALTSSHAIFYDEHDNNRQRPSYKHYLPLRDVDNNEYRERQTQRKIPQQNRKLKTENDWTDHNTQPFQDLNSLIIKSNSLANRPKIPDKYPLTSDIDKNGKHVHHHHHHHPNQIHSRHPLSNLSQQTHHHYHRHQNQTHLHDPSSHHNHYHQQNVPIRPHPDSGPQQFDVLLKDSARPPYYQHTRDEYHSPPSLFHNPTHYLPPNHHHKTYTARFPSDYYGTLARQIQRKNWEESKGKTNIYKPDRHARWYDHRLHDVVDKRLTV